MMRDLQAADDASALVTLTQVPMPVRLPPGSAVFVVRGEAWITQEGMRDDIVLGPGGRFEVRQRGTIVVSATRGCADVYLASAQRMPALGVDLHQWLEANARQARAEAVEQCFVALSAWVRKTTARLRHAVSGGWARRNGMLARTR